MPDPQDPQQKEQIKQVVEEVLQEQKQQSGTSQPAQEQQKVQQCIVDCANARNLCLQALSYALAQGGNFTNPENYNKIQDCAELCDITAKALLRQSDLKSDLAKMCSTACEACVKVCKQFSQDQQMQACAQYVQTCAESCKQM